MRLEDIYSHKDWQYNGIFSWVKPVISFEVFPPKENENDLYDELKKLKKYEPAFVSLTCNAGGKNNDSLDLADKIKNDLSMDVMPHLTCICNDKKSIEKKLQLIENMNIENVLALRGDKPEDNDNYCSDFEYANELVSFIKEKTDLSIAAAGYPEGHIDSPDLFTDIENLKKKVDAGANVIFTQLFFDNDKFFSYIQLVRDAGINVPIIPGIMPIISLNQIKKITSLAKITIPQSLYSRIEKFKDSPDDMKKLGIDFTSYQCRQLIDAEVSGLHFYTLNKAYSTSEILDNIL